MISFSSITLTNFVWLDQYEFSGVVQQQERALNGAPHIENTLVSVGRPITLFSDIEDADLFKALQAHALANQAPFNMNINGTTHSVIWRHLPQAVSGKPIARFSDGEPEYFEKITLTLQTA